MLFEFLVANRADLIERCRIKVAQRPSSRTSDSALEHGIPHFLDQIIKTLQVEQTPDPMASRKVSGPAGGGKPFFSEIGETATLHGRELLQHGYTIDQVVHDYGDLCQAIMDLARERDEPFKIEEYGTLNRCLDNAIADAVTEFAQQHDTVLVKKAVQALNEQLAFLAHELRNHIHSAMLALTAIKAGTVGTTGSTGAVLERSLITLRSLVDRALADVRVTAGMPVRRELISVVEFIRQLKMSATLEANRRGCIFTVSDVDPTLAIVGDRDLLLSAAGNLLQNAFKFTKNHTDVSLHAYAAADRIVLDIEDHCGGLPPGLAENMFKPFTQGSADRSGLGLGLAIARRSLEACNGTVRVRDVPGSGCIFSIDLPRGALPERASQHNTTTAPVSGGGPSPAKMPRILVVDDGDSRLVVTSILECHGYEVATAADGYEAFALQRQFSSDVLITDIFMPEKDGLELIHAFRKNYPKTRILAMSGAPPQPRGLSVGFSRDWSRLCPQETFRCRSIESGAGRNSGCRRGATLTVLWRAPVSDGEKFEAPCPLRSSASSACRQRHGHLRTTKRYSSQMKTASPTMVSPRLSRSLDVSPGLDMLTIATVQPRRPIL